MKELISENQLDKFKDLIKSLGKIEGDSEEKLFSLPIESDKEFGLRILITNDNILGLGVDDKRRIYSQKLFREDVKLKYLNLINLGKIAEYLIEEVLGKDIDYYKDKSNQLRSNALELIGLWYPEHRKSLIKFRMIDSEEINSLAVRFNKEKKEVQLLINPENYIKIALKEVLILGMKKFSRFNKKIDNKSFNFLLSVYGSLLLLHELYHVLFRHIYDDYSEQLSGELENIIMDEYINSRLIFTRLIRPEILDILKLLGLKRLEVNSGIGTSIYLTGYLKKDLIKVDKYVLTRLIKYFRELKPLGFDQMIEFLSECREEDKIFLAIQNLNYKEAFDSFSTPIRKFIKEFIDLTRDESLVPEELKDSNSNDRNSQEGKRNETGSNQEDKRNETGSNQEDSSNSKDKETDNQENSSGNNLEQNIEDLSQVGDRNSTLESILEIPDELLDRILSPVIGEVFDNDSLEGIKFDKVLIELLERLNPEDKIEVRVDWQEKLETLIKESTGINLIYNPDGQNRRYEGQLGRLELVPAFENIILSFDISGSMTSEDYRVIINYVEDLIRRFNIGEFQIDSTCNIGYVFWAGLNQGEEYVIQPKPLISSDRIFEEIKLHEKKAKLMVGLGTDFGAFIRPFVLGKFKGFIPDLMIVFTDGQFLDLVNLNEKLSFWYSNNKEKILFVLTSNEFIDCLKSHDDTYLERTIIFQEN